VVAIWVIIQSASCLVLVALVFSPLAIFIANLFERRGSFRLLLQQEYSPFTSSLFYASSASALIAFIITIAGKLSGVQEVLAARMLESFLAQRSQVPPEMLARIEGGFLTPGGFSALLSFLVLLFVFGIAAIVALWTVFRLSVPRSVMVVSLSGLVLLPASYILPVISTLLASPFLLLLLFLFLRGYVGEISRSHRARVSFKQNLEAATLNPVDASAHYNLGLIHQQRGDLDAARERFERAVKIDENEIDSHYQLGRIARQQQRPSDAIGNFEQVVARDPSHSQYEIWREVAATYIAAGQFEDARTALEQFLEHRPSDPEGLYLMGRAHAGLGHRREAASSMQACIEAVKTSPAYKYRMSKRWLNEAQQFIKSSQ
jgi:tetratricopeptide (TPR) repeat protein